MVATLVQDSTIGVSEYDGTLRNRIRTFSSIYLCINVRVCGMGTKSLVEWPLEFKHTKSNGETVVTKESNIHSEFKCYHGSQKLILDPLSQYPCWRQPPSTVGHVALLQRLRDAITNDPRHFSVSVSKRVVLALALLFNGRAVHKERQVKLRLPLYRPFMRSIPSANMAVRQSLNRKCPLLRFLLIHGREDEVSIVLGHLGSAYSGGGFRSRLPRYEQFR